MKWICAACSGGCTCFGDEKPYGCAYYIGPYQPDQPDWQEEKEPTCDGCSNLRGNFCMLGTAHCTRRAEDYYKREGKVEG